MTFCQRISPDASPRLIRSLPRLPVIPNECFANVESHVRRFGGEAVHGWAIGEVPRVFIEAEFHAVWKTEQSMLFDVNPRRAPDRTILFLPQPELTFEGNTRGNIRQALVDDPAVHDFIEQAERRFRFLEPHKPGLIPINLAEWKTAFPHEQQIEAAFFRLVVHFRGNREPCVCGSGKQFRKCHKPYFDAHPPRP